MVMVYNIAGALTMGCFATTSLLEGQYWDPVGPDKPTLLTCFRFYIKGFMTSFAWHYGGILEMAIPQALMVAPGQMPLLGVFSNARIEWLHIDTGSQYFKNLMIFSITSTFGFILFQTLLFSDSRRKIRAFVASIIMSVALWSIQIN